MIPAASTSPRPRDRSLSDEAGFSLPEVLMSAIVLVLVAISALTALSATGNAGAEERHRSQAQGIAQDDQARVRSLPITELGVLEATRTVTVDGNTYTVESRGDYASDDTDTDSCTESGADPQYIEISSTVSWPSMGSRPPVVLESIVAPPNGSLAPDRGALAVSVQNAQSQPMPNVTITGSGPASFSGVTAANGCVIFGDLPAGTYSVTPVAPGMVDNNGNAPQAQSADVAVRSTNTLVFQFDQPGSIKVSFTTRVGGVLQPSAADSIVVFNSGMTTHRTFGTPGTQTLDITASNLFPFSSPTSVYAGTCTNNTPDIPAGAAAIASVPVTAGTQATPAIELPALHLTVYSGTSSTPGAVIPNARVGIGDIGCNFFNPTYRTYFTNAAGKLSNPGLPWSSYSVCAQNAANTRRAYGFPTVKNMTTGTSLNLYLGNASTGVCPP